MVLVPVRPGNGHRPADEPTTARRLDPATLGDHVDRLYRAARTMCNSREEAEDLVQETFARVLQRPRFLHSEDDIGYLLQVLPNTFVSGRRTAGRRPQPSEAPDDLMRIEDPSAPRPGDACPRVGYSSGGSSRRAQRGAGDHRLSRCRVGTQIPRRQWR